MECKINFFARLLFGVGAGGGVEGDAFFTVKEKNDNILYDFRFPFSLMTIQVGPHPTITGAISRLTHPRQPSNLTNHTIVELLTSSVRKRQNRDRSSPGVCVRVPAHRKLTKANIFMGQSSTMLTSCG